MAFLTPEDMGQVIYDYQLEQITEGDDIVVAQALLAAEQETRAYLAPNLNNRASFDGRALYDVAAIFATTGTERPAILVQHAVTIAKWHLIQLCEADILYDKAEKAYDRATAWLVRVAKGELILDGLPTITVADDTAVSQWSYGSRTKFNHD
jgi:phage gp36-like protein